MKKTKKKTKQVPKAQRQAIRQDQERLTALKNNKVMMLTQPLKLCKACGTKNAPKKCGTCLIARYCNQACQQNDWGKHKVVCTAQKE